MKRFFAYKLKRGYRGPDNIPVFECVRVTWGSKFPCSTIEQAVIELGHDIGFVSDEEGQIVYISGK